MPMSGEMMMSPDEHRFLANMQSGAVASARARLGEQPALAPRILDMALFISARMPPAAAQLELLRALLDAGAKSAPQQRGQTPCWAAAMAGSAETILALGAEADVATNATCGIPPLLIAAVGGHAAAVEALCDLGADMYAAEPGDGMGMNALHLAAQHGHVNVVRALHGRGATLDARNEDGSTAVLVAAKAASAMRHLRGGHIAVLRVLHELGADLEAEDDSGMSPLVGAIHAGAEDAARTLLELGVRRADAPRDDNGGGGGGGGGADGMAEGRTTRHPDAIHFAAMTGSAAMVALVREFGGDPAAMFKGHTVADFADKGGHAALATALRDEAAAGEQLAARRAAKECDHCGKAAAPHKCARCTVGRYCSAGCQKAAWKQGGHRAECKVLTAAKQ